MSISGMSSTSDRIFRHGFRRRKNSDELDVFEAAEYYSSAVDNRQPGLLPQKSNREEPLPVGKSPNFRNRADKVAGDREGSKKFRRPSTPGAKLANFVISLFNQAHPKKKKHRVAPPPPPESAFRIVARRSSFSTPRVPRKPENNDSISTCSVPATQTSSAYEDFRRIFESRRLQIRTGKATINQARQWEDEGDDGSDSSSDLFDLPNHNRLLHSSPYYSVSDHDLPVYGTTRGGTIIDIGSRVFWR
ncbi:hypothetical protein M569_03224 [Genlisea aurea]|uniref:Uncharacterized protein n=1 Tax=Genlisea aurea TaxID=192259 RepID=S8CX87_9LAMI|nr:hypothetical protein M569_03224 [Genlisea aurea]